MGVVRDININAAQEIRRLRLLVAASKKLNSSLDTDTLLTIILEEAKNLLEAERATIFLADHEKKELWSKVIGEKSLKIRILISTGIIGHVVMTGEPVMTRNAYRLPYFCPEVDRETGFVTRSVLCVPLRGDEGRVMGGLQVLNKKKGNFTAVDRRFLEDLADLAALALEKAIAQQNLLAKRKMEEELEVAGRIQKSLLPERCPEVPGIEIAALCRPASHIGATTMISTNLTEGAFS